MSWQSTAEYRCRTFGLHRYPTGSNRCHICGHTVPFDEVIDRADIVDANHDLDETAMRDQCSDTEADLLAHRTER